MPTRSDFDNAFNDLRTAVEAAIIRCTTGGPAITDQDLANLNAVTARVQQIGAGTFPGVPPVGVGSLSFSPASGTGGATFTGTITLDSPAVAAEVFAISSDTPSATPNSAATVPAGAVKVDFPVTTVPVSSQTVVHIAATSPLHSFTAAFTLNP